ncbi:hypothetical protein PYCCODRAFT_915130 [Trametes coccinea BRFM310]|uniref:Uncharacterized protein n=1 Tax=Trametes coccinea (strain BRFM310) TaxID=1353009 RepID=A0A1Y2ICC9_TRAC3|nr:hypothetical protein PYCCODRAFT_915130 [Trametes coccinea BRFM310]
MKFVGFSESDTDRDASFALGGAYPTLLVHRRHGLAVFCPSRIQWVYRRCRPALPASSRFGANACRPMPLCGQRVLIPGAEGGTIEQEQNSTEVPRLSRVLSRSPRLAIQLQHHTTTCLLCRAHPQAVGQVQVQTAGGRPSTIDGGGGLLREDPPFSLSELYQDSRGGRQGLKR